MDTEHDRPLQHVTFRADPTVVREVDALEREHGVSRPEARRWVHRLGAAVAAELPAVEDGVSVPMRLPLLRGREVAVVLVPCTEANAAMLDQLLGTR